MISHVHAVSRITRGILQWLSRLLAFALLALVLSALATVVVVPRAIHGAALTVLTGSMTPEIPVGSLVIIQPVDPRTLHVGDIATYQPEPGQPTLITHRIVKVRTHNGLPIFTFKGDANPTADIEPVSSKQVRGRVVLHVPYLGAVRDLLHTRGGASGLAMLLLTGYAIAQLWSLWRHRSSSGQPVPTDQAALALQLLVSTLPMSSFAGLLPSQVASLLRMELFDESAEHFTVAVAREPDQLDDLEQFLSDFAPVSIVRSDIVSVPLCQKPSAMRSLPHVDLAEVEDAA